MASAHDDVGQHVEVVPFGVLQGLEVLLGGARV
jgi:hypothetical protein